ncbi:MAG: glycosyltransferase, family [Chloroflexi bacterium]|nr:glycosyltransferase, family [Chloroflexota bacterium]
MTSQTPTVVFFPEGAFGPTNNLVGMAHVLKQRGVRCIFVVEESFAGTLVAKGFEEQLMRLKPKPEVEEEPGQFWKDFIRDTAPQFRKSPYDQLETLIQPIWAELVDGAKYVNDRLKEIFDTIRPDVIVEDNVVAFPAVVSSGIPWVRSVCCNPAEIKDQAVPPAFSGLPSADPTEWSAFRQRYSELHANLHADFDAFARSHGCPPLPKDEFMYESPYLNLYLYPEAADYQRARPLGPTWQRLDSCVRATDAAFDLPEQLQGPGKLIYVSLGSLGSADTDLMRRLIEVFGETKHRVIISMGPQQGVLTLPNNMYGEQFLPQPSILPMVDLVVTHGGNNTVTECFYFGKPMVVLSLFWDQHDNAQRLDETGFGVRFSPAGFDERAMLGAVDHLLSDEVLQARMRRISAQLKANPGTVKAANLIERLAKEKRPILR